MSILDRPRPRSAHAEFWTWFEHNEARLFSFEDDESRLIDDLVAALHGVHDDLTFELGPVVDGQREFVVSAGGIRAAFPAVESLVGAAPALPRWRITKFRPRRPVCGRLELAGISVDADDVRVTCRRRGPRWCLTLHLPGYRPTPDNRYEQIGYLWLDQALGEYDVEAKIGAIEFVSTDHDTPTDVVSLNRLPLVIDAAAFA